MDGASWAWTIPLNVKSDQQQARSREQRSTAGRARMVLTFVARASAAPSSDVCVIGLDLRQGWRQRRRRQRVQRDGMDGATGGAELNDIRAT